MCFDTRASQRALLFSWLTSALLFFVSHNAEDRAIALFFAFVGLMQLWDWVLWENPSATPTNAFITKTAMLSNHVQPLVFAALAAAYTGKLGGASALVLVIYLLAVTWYTVQNWTAVDYTFVDPESTPGLFWKWNSRPYAGIVYGLFVASLAVTSVENFSFPANWVLGAVSVFTFWASMQYKQINSIGRMWCHTAAYVALVAPAARVLAGA